MVILMPRNHLDPPPLHAVGHPKKSLGPATDPSASPGREPRSSLRDRPRTSRRPEGPNRWSDVHSPVPMGHGPGAMKTRRESHVWSTAMSQPMLGNEVAARRKPPETLWLLFGFGVGHHERSGYRELLEGTTAQATAGGLCGARPPGSVAKTALWVKSEKHNEPKTSESNG